MSFQVQKAQKSKVKLKLGLFGASGSGKTYSALKLAYGICEDRNKICVIDTENGSASLYADSGEIGRFNVITFDAPFSPERYIEAISAAMDSGAEVVIIDSYSHEWEGEGGIVDIHNGMPGNSFQNRGKVKKRHKKLKSAILQSPIHIILTGRKKQKYEMQNKGSTMTVEKLGLDIIQEDGIEYEVTLSLDIDQTHKAISTKDRTGLFVDLPEFTISEETGRALMGRAQKGIDVAEKDLSEAMAKIRQHIDSSDKESSEFEAKLGQIKKNISDSIIFTEQEKQKLLSYVNEYASE